MHSANYQSINDQLREHDVEISFLNDQLSSLHDALTPISDLHYCKYILHGAVDSLSDLSQQIQTLQAARSTLTSLQTIQASQKLSNLEKIGEKLNTKQSINEYRKKLVQSYDISSNTGLNNISPGGDNLQSKSFIDILEKIKVNIQSNNQEFENQSKIFQENFINDDIEQKIKETTAKIDRIKKQAALLSSSVNQATKFHKLAMQDSLFGATVRGDLKNVALELSKPDTGNPNNLHDGKKPIYYAMLCGHSALFVRLLDCTMLSKTDKRELHEELTQLISNSNEGKSERFIELKKMLDLFDYAKTYDHLWGKANTPLDGMIAVFKDYYNPSLFKSMKNMPSIVNRILMGAWNRSTSTIELATAFCGILANLKKYPIPPTIEKLQAELKDLSENFQQLLANGQANPYGAFSQRLYYWAYQLRIPLTPIQGDQLFLTDSADSISQVPMSDFSGTQGSHFFTPDNPGNNENKDEEERSDLTLEK